MLPSNYIDSSNIHNIMFIKIAHLCHVIGKNTLKNNKWKKNNKAKMPQ